MDARLINVVEVVVISSVAGYMALVGAFLLWWRPRWLRPQTGKEEPGTDVTIVLAARNESANLGPCLESLLTQSGVAQIRVVDDHSTDDTATVVRSYQARDRRVRLLSAPELPDGWLGKTHALHFGTTQIETPFLLFTDADVIFGPGIVGEALRRASGAKLDHLGAHFFIDCRSIAEEICAPVLVLSSGLALFGTARSLGAATGAFNLVRTRTYEAHGGHAPIRSEVVDDVALARHLKAGGASSDFVAMGDFLKVRLFVGYSGFVAAVRRSAIPFLQWGSPTVLLLALICMSFALLPMVVLMIAILSVYLDGPMVLACAGPLPYILGLTAVFLVRGLHNGRRRFLACYPAALFALAGSVFLAGLSQLRREPVVWRGRTYPLARNRLSQT